MQLSDRVGSLGLDRAYSVMEQLAAFMTRMLAHTLIRSMYLITHETLRTQWQGQVSFKRGKQWIQQDPSKWQVRDAVTVNLGASVGERQRIAAVFDSLMSKQAQLAQLGMEDILIDVTGFYTAAMQWLRINDVDNPERYFIDPRSDAAKKAMQQRAVSKQQAQQKQDAMMQQAIGLEQVRVALDKYKADSDLQFKYYAEVLNAQIEEAKLVTKGIVDFMAARKIAKEAHDGTNKTAANSGSESAANEQLTDGSIGDSGAGDDSSVASG